MNLFIKPLLIASGSIVFGAASALAGGYYYHDSQVYSHGDNHLKTYVREYTINVPRPIEHVPLGDYCLYEPGDSYGLSYTGGCDYDGGYGGQQTVIIDRTIDRGSVYVGSGVKLNHSIHGGAHIQKQH
jgi:hypothetical protein